jgi:cell division protein FtsB
MKKKRFLLLILILLLILGILTFFGEKGILHLLRLRKEVVRIKEKNIKLEEENQKLKLYRRDRPERVGNGQGGRDHLSI